MFLGDLETHENPADPFRSEYHKFEKKDQVCEKAMTKQYLDINCDYSRVKTANA